MNLKKIKNPALTVGGMILAGGLTFMGVAPALATPDSGGWSGIFFGDTPPSDAELEAALEVTGWPEEAIYAGETFTLTFQVDSELLGAPDLEGALIGIGFYDEIIDIAALNSSGEASVNVRPLITGPLVFTPYFIGDEAGQYKPVEGDSGTVTVNQVPVTTSYWFDQEESDGNVTAYGGGDVAANVLVEPFCADDSDGMANTFCYATYGVPYGSWMIMRDGETLASADITGNVPDRLFAAPGEDLSDGQRAQFSLMSFTAPDLLLGSPGSFAVTAGFDSNNWFMTHAAETKTVNMNAQEVKLEVLIGDDWQAGSASNINANTVVLNAFFAPTETFGAPITGTITFFANGEEISGPIEYDPETGFVSFEWQPLSGGTHSVTAEFVPDSLNHLPSVSSAQKVDIIIPPAPNPTPKDDDEKDPADVKPAEDNSIKPAADSKKQPETLAATGDSVTQMAGFAAGSVLLLLGATLLLRRKLA